MQSSTTLNQEAQLTEVPLNRTQQSMAPEGKNRSNGFVRAMRKAYNPLGFSKGYNAFLWLIFDGAMLGFCLARFEYLNVWGVFCKRGSSGGNSASPGECYWYENFPRNRIGITLHLVTIIPAAFLVVFQFIPIIRKTFILYHRIAGYTIFLLVIVSDVGVIMIANHAFGGDFATQAWAGLLVVMTSVSLILAYINVKRLQVEQHRAWMLRSWFYFASIITLRIIMVIAASIESSWPGSQNYVARSCHEIVWTYNASSLSIDRVYRDYPACSPSNAIFAPDGFVPVLADFRGGVGPTSIGAGLGANFAMAGMLSLFLHAVGIEIYLHLTPREFERLRHISYEKQLEAGMRKPGSAGLVVQRLGDAAEWVPEKSESE